MRLIGTLDRRELAERFAAFLKTEGIDAHVESEDSKFELWVKDEDRVKDSVGHLENFRADPDAAKYLRAKGLALELLKKEEKRRLQVQKNMVKVSPSHISRKRSPLTILLIGICILVALLSNFGEYQEGSVFRALAFNAVDGPESLEIIQDNQQNYDAMGVRLASIKEGQFWRLLTPAFIHHGTIHLLFNMFWIYQLGSIIENRAGTVFLALLVVAAAVVPNFFQGVMPQNVGGSSPVFLQGTEILLCGFGGMSGVIYGLFGFMWMKTLFDPGAGMSLPQSTIIILVGWLIFCMTPLSREMLGLNVANWAHAIGLIVGMFAGMMPSLSSKNR